MRSFFSMFLLLAIFFFVSTIPVLAQVTQEPDPGGISFEDLFLNLASFVAAIPIVIDFVNKTVKLSGIALQVFSWVVGIIMGILAYLLDFGMFSEFTFWQVILVSIGASLAANGLADVGLIRKLLNLIPGITIKSYNKNA